MLAWGCRRSNPGGVWPLSPPPLLFRAGGVRTNIIQLPKQNAKKRIDCVLDGLWTPGTRVGSLTELTEVPGSRYAYRTVVPVQLELIVARVYRT